MFAHGLVAGAAQCLPPARAPPTATATAFAWILQALAQVLQSHIVVYCVGMPVVEMGEDFKGAVQ